MRLLCSLSLLGLVACAAPQPAPSIDDPASLWVFEEHADHLRAVSCPDEVSFQRPRSMPIGITEMDRNLAEAPEDAIIGARFAGVWHLTAEEPNFGGLSGLDVMPSGGLLSITDAGAFVWIGIDPDTQTPDGIGSIGYMLNAEGEMMTSKRKGDSEGLAFHEGLALVSFERDHRIEAFDIEGCGVAARAASLVDFPAEIEGRKIPDNQGAEALSLLDDGSLSVGFEFSSPSGSPHGLIMTDGALDTVEYSGQAAGYLLTGTDHKSGLSVQVFRAYDPVRGNRIRVYAYDQTSLRANLHLKAPLPVDNIEGVAIADLPNGRTRLWLISDDNFNPRQRTLLFAFDLFEAD